jgi:MoaA/NifB/PqqE/SkfB family radical SAM enzyme
MEKINLYKQKILTGSSIVSKNTTTFDRENFMVENMSENLAFKTFMTKNSANFNEALNLFKNNFITYRKNWKRQPADQINRIHNPEKVQNIPLCVDIETAAICDLACPFCYRESLATPDKIISDELCFNVIDQAADLGVPSLKFNWRGEPLLNPKLHEYIRYSKENGIIDTIINTNATHLDERKSHSLINSGLDHLIYSFDGGSKETYEKMRPGRFKFNSFDDVYENIKNFKKIRSGLGAKFPTTKIQMILTDQTSSEIDSFFKLFSNYVDDVTVTQYTERGGEVSHLSEFDLQNYQNLCKKHNLVNNPAYLKDPSGILFVANKRKPCEQPFQRLMVTYDGRVSMCCYDWGSMHPVGFISDKPFGDPHKDKYIVIKSINESKKGFDLMSGVKLPPVFNKPLEKISSLKDIWNGMEINKVRQSHIEGNIDKIEVCKGCSFKDTYEWIN